MYSGYGGLSSYGGMGSYGGLGGYGSSLGGASYGSSLGTSYGNYGANKVGQEGKDPKDPKQSQDKRVVQEWFKMMGGLRSILELGVAFLALANFSMTASELVSKFMQFSKEKSQSIAAYISSKIPKKAIRSMMTPERRSKIAKYFFMVTIRVFALFLLALGVKMRRQMKKEARKKHQQMLEQMKELRGQQYELEEEGQAVETIIKQTHDANL